MKPIQTSIVEVDNMPGEEVEFTISAADAGLIMKSLAGLYSNRTKAAIREYSTNAYDSHVEAGHPERPIDITLPSALHPFFTVKDLGTGMSATELKETYTQFGRSTRRDSDDYTGSLGYGSKSALAYTNSFTITAVKNGMQTIAVVTRKDNGTMVLKEVLHIPTTEPNGVTIQIPVHNIDEFNRTARKFYRFWPTGTVEINGEPHICELKTDNLLDTNMYRNMDGTNNCWIVMGNVPYPIENPQSLFPTNNSFQPFVAYVDNGSVEFTPSREALDYTDYTRSALQLIVDSYLANVKATAEAEVGQAKTKWEALKASRKWNDILGQKFQYKGEDIPQKIEFLNSNGHSQDVWQVNKHWSPVSKTYEINLDNTVLVITSSTATVGTYHRRRLQSWGRSSYCANGLPTYVYFTEEPTWSNEWIDPSLVISWETIKAQTPPPVRVKGAARKKGTFDLMDTTGKWTYEQTITTQKYWVEHTYARDTRVSTWQEICKTFSITDAVVVVPANRVGKFKRENPSIQNLREYLKTQVDLDGNAMYTDEQRSFFSLDYYVKIVFNRLDETLVSDPDLKRLIKIAKNKTIKKPDDYETNRHRASMLNLRFKSFEQDGKECNAITRRYPLIMWNGAGTQNMQHIYIYLNAAYEAEGKGGTN